MCIPIFLICLCISWSETPQMKERRISWHAAELLSEEQTPFSLGNTLAPSLPPLQQAAICTDWVASMCWAQFK